ncbi:MAG: right-handed parallel beta-helix repeat-containing protein [Planctomycetes bacterium]|nr:right-handed parallel beta-helix repeat-containing protein [Planctomycetota bacterium]
MHLKRIAFLMAFMALAPTATLLAAPLSGSYTVGDTGTYADLTTAFAAVNANGISADVTFTLSDGDGTITESGTPTLTAPFTGGGEATWRVTVQMTGGIIINANSNTNVIALNDIVRFTVDGTDGTLYLQNSSSDGIAITKTAVNTNDDIRIENVTIRTTGAAAVNLANSNVTRVTMTNCTVRGNTYSVLSNGASNITINGGTYSDNGVEPYQTNNIKIIDGSNFTIQNCTLSKCDEDAVFITAASPTSAILIDTVIFSAGTIGTGAANSAAIHLDNEFVRGVTINNCTINGDYYGVYMNGSQMVTIQGGSIQNTQNDGLHIENSTGAEMPNFASTTPNYCVLVDTVTFSTIGTGGNCAPVYLQGTMSAGTFDVKNIAVRGCTITGDNWGIYADSVNELYLGSATKANTISSTANNALHITSTEPTTDIDIIRLSTNTVNASYASIYLANENIRNVTIDSCLLGTATLSAGKYGVYMNGSQNVTILSSTIRNTVNDAIYIENTTGISMPLFSATNPLYNITINAVTTLNVGTASSAASVYLYGDNSVTPFDVRNVYLKACNFTTDDYGVRVSTADEVYVGSAGNPNTITASAVASVYVTSSTPTTDIDIIELTSNNLPSGSSIYLANENVRNVLISNCSIGTAANPGGRYGIRLDGAQLVTIQNMPVNSIRNCSDHGIYIQNTTGTQMPDGLPGTNIVINNVKIENIGTAFSSAGIYINGNAFQARNVTITNCSIDGDDYGIAVQSADKIYIGTAGNGNSVYSTSANDGIYITSTVATTRIDIIELSTDTISTAGTGSSINLANANVKNVTIDDCTIGSAVTADTGGFYGIQLVNADNISILGTTAIRRTDSHGIFINNTSATSSIAIDGVSFTSIGTSSNGAAIKMGSQYATGVTINNCTIDGGTYGVWADGVNFSITGGSITSCTQDGIYITNSTITATTGITIDTDISGTGASYAGVHLNGQYVKGVTIQTCTINASGSSYCVWMEDSDDITLQTVTLQNGSSSLFASNSDDVLITDCAVSGSAVGLNFNSYTTANTIGITIDAVSFSGVTNTAIWISDADAKFITIQNCPTITATTYGILTDAIDGSTITNCSISNCNNTGISITNSGAVTINSFTISTVTISNCGGYGVFINNGSAPVTTGYSLSGLNISNIGTAAANYSAIGLQNANNVTISSSTLASDNDGYGLYVTGGVSLDINTNTSITAGDSTYAAVYISGATSPTIGTAVSITSSAADPGGPYGIYLATSGNSTVQDCTLNGFYSYGIFGSDTSNITVQNNTLNTNNLTDYGICLINIPSKFTVTGNSVKEFDYTGLYVDCTNTVSDSLISKNVFKANSGSAGTYGIYLSNADGTNATKCNATNNIVYNCNIVCLYMTNTAFWNFYNNSFYGNVPYYTSGYGITALQSASTDNAFKNNIFQNTGFISSDSYGTYDYSLCYNIDSSSQSNFQSDYNCFYGTGTNNLFAWDTTYCATLLNWQSTSGGQDANSIIVNPWFTDIAGDNLRLWYYSECKTKGTPLASVTDDFEGDLRDAGTPDIGADEDLSSAPVPAPANGNLDVGGGNNDYGTLQAALTALSARGVSGNTTLTVYVNTTFANGAVTIPAIRGTSYRSLGAARTLTILASTPGWLIDAQSSTPYAMEFNGSSNIIIDGFTLQNSLSSSVYVTGNSYSLQIKNCTIQFIDTNADDTADVTMPSGNPFPGAAGVHISTNAGDNITITDCAISADAHGIHCDYADGLAVSGTSLPGTQITGISTSTFIGILIRYSNDSVISKNTVTGTIGLILNPPSTYRGYGIRSSYCDRLEISENNFTGTQPSVMEIIRNDTVDVLGNTITSTSTAGIQLNNSSGGTVADNSITMQSTSYNAIGINAADLADIGGTIIDSNTFNGGQYGINVIGGWGTGINPCIIKNNVIYGNSLGCIRLAAASYWRVYFNTCYAAIYSSAYSIVRLQEMDPNSGAEAPGVTPSQYNEFYQNIFFNYNDISDYSYIYNVDSASQTGFVSNNNDLYGTGTNAMFYWGSTSYDTLSQWQTGTSQDASSITLNPYFTDASAGDFSLWDFSPCQNRWANTTGVTIDKNDAVRADPPDAGAIEDTVIGADNRATGTVTVGGTSPDYATVTDAYNSLVTNGINGSVIVNVAPGIYPSLSMASQIRGTTVSNTVTFRSADTNPVFIDAASASNYALEITNSSNVIFENFLFENSLSHGIYITGNSWNNTFTDCIVQNVDTNNDDEGASAIYINSPSADTITINGCTIQPDLTSNTTQPPYNTGIYIEDGDDALVKGNTINGNADVWANIFITESDRTDITANIILSGLVGIMVANSDGSSTNPVYLTNNSCYLSRYCVYITYSTYTRAYYNTLFGQPSSIGESVILMFDSTYVKLKNNIINNVGGGNYLIYVNAGSTTGFESNYNDIYSSGTYNLYWNTTAYSTITAWRTASGQDLNSINLDPVLVDPANNDFHILELVPSDPSLSLMDTGYSVESATGLTNMDFEGTLRTIQPATEPRPDIGADEAPPDVTPPDNVTNFSMLTGTNQVFLYWTNPSYSLSPPYAPLQNVDFIGVLILRDTQPITVTPADGQGYALNSSIGTAKVVYNQSSSSGADMSWTDTGSGMVGGLTAYQTYYYRVFTFDERPNYPSTEVSGSMIPTNPIALTYSPTSFSESSSEKGLDPAPLTMEIWNAGDRVMAWTASLNSTWVGIDSTSGSVTGPFSATNDTDTITLTFNIAILKIGTYFTYITLTADDPEPGLPDTVKTISIMLEILPPPTLERSPSSLTFDAIETDPNPDAKIVQIWNGGSDNFEWTADKNVSWLSLSPKSGTIATQTADMSVTALTSGLSPGTYTGKVTITADSDGGNLIGSPKTVNVTLTVAAKAPEISTNQDSFIWYAVQGGDDPASQDLFIWNSSGGSIPLNWTLTENVSWLAPNSLAGSSADTSTVNKVKLSVASTNLTIVNSPYTGIMTISGVGASGSKTINVRLEVLKTLPPTIEVTPASISVNAIEGITDSVTSSFKLKNAGGSIMNYIVDDDMSWLFLQSSNGQSVGETDSIGFTVLTAGLTSAASPYSGYIYIEAGEATNSPVMIPVILNIYPQTANYIEVKAGDKNTQNTTESTMAVQMEMLQFSITANASQNIKLASLTITASGTANESVDVLPGNVKLYADVNNNGIVDSDDIQLGDGASFSADNEELTITNFNLTIPDGVTKYLILSYSLSGTAEQDMTFKAEIANSLHVTAVMETTEETVLTIGTFPVEGGVKTISNTGSLTAALGPANPSPQTIANTNTNVGVFQIALTSSSVEQIAVGTIIFSSLGSGNEPSDIARAYLVKDTNSNGRWDADEAAISPYSQVYTKDNGNITFTGLSEIIPVAGTVYWLLVYDFSGNSVNDSTYNAWLSNESNISAKGLSSNKSTVIVGTPLQSGVITSTGDPVKIVSVTEEDTASNSTCFASIIRTASPFAGIYALLAMLMTGFILLCFKHDEK